MPPASSRHAADVAPFASPRTRPPLRIGSAESRTSTKKQESHHLSACDAYSYISGSIQTWPFGKDEPVAESIEVIFQALERLERREYGEKRVDRSALSV
jgi:hypothetical protein